MLQRQGITYRQAILVTVNACVLSVMLATACAVDSSKAAGYCDTTPQSVACRDSSRLASVLASREAERAAKARERMESSIADAERAAVAIDALVRIESCLHHKTKSAQGGGVPVDCAATIAPRYKGVNK